MSDFKKGVFQAYARTISHGDHETAYFMALRALRMIMVAVCLLFVAVGCNPDRTDVAANPAAVNSASAKAPTVLVAVLPGTQWRHYKLDADITFIGQTESGAVIMDIRIDGSQQIKVTYPNPSDFLITVVKNPDWIKAGIVPVNPKRD